jgi:uncharacterized protein (TIGR03083 family)
MPTINLHEQHGISPRESYSLGTSMTETFIVTLEGLDGPSWDTVTRCAPWTVKDMVAHLIGWAEALTSFRELGKQSRRALGRVKEFGNVVDAQNAVQVDDRKHLSSTEVLTLFRDRMPAEVRARKRFGTGLRFVPFYLPYLGGATNAGYAFNTIFLRDLLIHRLDIADALGIDFEPTEAERRVAIDMLKDWARRTKADVQVIDGDEMYVAGAGIDTIEAPLAQVVEALSGRRDPASLKITGDRHRIEGLLAQGVPV